ncbi:MAG: beta-galactosidase [Clostridia bacterium]|nr:beta-galactosidase [Clostridia bacterium]
MSNKTVSMPRPEHPNPQWKRDSFVNLNGEWMFEIDNGKSGEERELWRADSLSSKITVPFCPESRLSGVGNTDFMLCVWYKKQIHITEGELDGNRVILHFGAADFETKLWVNGKRVGLTHVGGYVSFEYDITDALVAGDNLLTVCCYDDTRAWRQPSGKQSRKAYSHGCYYTRTTGIWQTVWYEIVPETYVKYAKITPDLANCSVSISAELVGTADLEAKVYYEGKLVGEAKKNTLSTLGNLEIALSEEHVWEIGNGRLYEVVITFGKDKVNSYFGLRSVEMKDGCLHINGKPVFMRLVLDQGFYPDGIYTAPTEEALVRDIKCGLMAGFNGARLHEKVFEPLFLYHADKLGYIVWGEYANWGLDNSNIAHLATFRPDWLASVRRDCNHPALVGWCPFNETWDDGPNRSRQNDELLRIVYEQTKLADPTRPCIDTSGNFHVVTDIYDVHDYDQNPETFKEHYDKLVTEGVLYDQVNNSHATKQHWKGEPVFMSEYGGIGFQLETADKERKTSWSYGKATHSYEEFYARYKGLTDALLDNPKMIGFCYTQLTDVEQEQNGLFDYNTREPKYDMSIISEINKRTAAIEK